MSDRTWCSMAGPAERFTASADIFSNRPLRTGFPRASDGGFWHADKAASAHQLWADGVYMVNPFLVEYGTESY